MAWRGPVSGSELCRAIRGVLAGDKTPTYWSRRAAARMVEVRDEYPWLDGREDNALVGTGDDLTWWTFAGGRANAALHPSFPGGSGSRRPEAISPSSSARPLIPRRSNAWSWA